MQDEGIRTERTHMYFQLRAGENGAFKVRAGHWNWALHIVISIPMGGEGTDVLQVLRMIRKFASQYELNRVTLVEARTQVSLSSNDLRFS